MLHSNKSEREMNLSVENVKTVANLTKKHGCLQLAGSLGWDVENFDEDAQMRQSILLDYLYESLMFGVQKGFSWHQVCGVLQIAAEFQQRTVGQPLAAAVRLYREIAQKYLGESKLSESNLRLFTSHLFETYLAHYQLYQIVFTRDREPMSIQQHLIVIPPPETYPLDEAKPLNIWEYEQNLEALEDEEKSRKDSLKAQEETVLKELAESGDKPFTAVDGTVTTAALNREQVSDLIKDAIQHHATQMEKLLQTKVEEGHEDLAFYLEKTALPRPAHLGPPPRTKSPQRLSAKTRGSGKLGPDGKSAASVKSKKSKTSAKSN